MPRINWEFNFGHLLTITTLVGSLFAGWHALELKAVEVRKDSQAIQYRLTAIELHQKIFLDQLEKVTINQEKTATLLDAHIKYTLQMMAPKQ